jgi:REP-associated tyrosine transposase
MGQKVRVQVAGATYHVTTQGVDGLDVFPDDGCRMRFLELLAESATKYGVRVRSYCLMTTHYHLLMTTTGANISRAMQHLNGRYARWFNVRHGRRGHVWAARFGGEPIETDAHLLLCIRYIALNPVRPGLARTPLLWRWSSYAALVGRTKPPPFLQQGAVLQLFGPNRRQAIERIRSFVEIAARPDADGLRLAA